MTDITSDLGPKIRSLRLARKLSLAEVALGSGVSEATMSRIENGHSQVSAPHLYGLAKIFGIEIAEFFQSRGQQLGRRSLTRAGGGTAFASPRLHALLLAGDLRAKAMHPFVNRTTAHSLEKVGGLLAHAGEEFLFVLNGPLLLWSKGHAEMRLETGDSLYFDAAEPHAYLTEAGREAVFLVVSSSTAPHPLKKDQPT